MVTIDKIKDYVKMSDADASKIRFLISMECAESLNFNITRLAEWLNKNPRPPANTAFTTGILRDIAEVIEDKVNE